jgi:hypothetical protein
MIVFAGCSYTWGSGLQYEYLHNEKGWSIDKINKVLPDNYHLENLSYEADEYRKQNNYPNLVSKELNKSFVIATYTNGGSNLSTIRPCLEHTCRIARTQSVETVVIQFTDWIRDCGDINVERYPGDKTEITTQEYIDSEIIKQIEQNVDFCNHLRNDRDPNLKDHRIPTQKYPTWIGLSWRNDLAKILKSRYPENFMPIYYNGEEYDSFDMMDDGLRLCDSMPGVKDEHLNSKGNKVIADSVIRKLKSYE